MKKNYSLSTVNSVSFSSAEKPAIKSDELSYKYDHKKQRELSSDIGASWK